MCFLDSLRILKPIGMSGISWICGCENKAPSGLSAARERIVLRLEQDTSGTCLQLWRIHLGYARNDICRQIARQPDSERCLSPSSRATRGRGCLEIQERAICNLRACRSAAPYLRGPSSSLYFTEAISGFRGGARSQGLSPWLNALHRPSLETPTHRYSSAKYFASAFPRLLHKTQTLAAWYFQHWFRAQLQNFT